MTTSTFIFRIARVQAAKGKKTDMVDITGGTPQQLVLGEYYNAKLDEPKALARLHWGQHHFLKGGFYIYQFSDGSYTSSFNKHGGIDAHIDVSINFDPHHIKGLLAQLEERSELLCKPPVGENQISELQDQLQLHITVKSDAVAEVSEFLSSRKGEKDRLTIRIAPRDIVEWKVVESTNEAFKASVGSTHVKLDVLMEGLFGKSGSVGTIDTVEAVRERFITQASSSKKRKSRRKKDASPSNDVVTESTKAVEPKKEVITVEDEDDDDIPL